MNRSRLRGNLSLLLLAVLEAGPAHGYAVIQTLRSSSGGVFELPEGSVYPALHELEGQGLISSSWDVSGPRRRRLYAISKKGQKALAAEREEWRGFATGVNAVLGLAT